MDPAGRADDDDRIEVIVPLQARFASTLRVMAAAIGADIGFSVDEIDDVRLGLNEAFTLLAEHGDGRRVRTTFAVDGHRVVIRLATDGSNAVEPDELAKAILHSVVDRYAFERDGITLEKIARETGLA